MTAKYRARSLLRRAGVEVIGARRENLLSLHLDRLFAHLGIDLVVDVGARQGEFGSWLRDNGYQGWIASFEPVTENFVALQDRCARDQRWVAFQLALGATAGRADINVSNNTVFSSFLTPTAYATDTFGAEPGTKQVESVAVSTLDEVAPQVLRLTPNPRTYLKLDTQGWDLEVLKGATAALEQVVALQTEVSCKAVYHDMPTMRASLEALDQLGFTPSGFFPVNRDDQLRVIEFDCVAVRA